MKAAITFIATFFALSAYGMKPDRAKQDSIIDTAIQVADTIGTRKTSMIFASVAGKEVIGWIMHISVPCEGTWMIIIVEKSAIQT
mgnify:CR=1 FL=1